MQCTIDVFNDVGEQVRSAIVDALAEQSLPVDRSFLAMGPIPAEESCKEVLVWISNTRLYDAASPDTLQENRVLVHYGMAFDVNVRIGLCYVESDNDGDAMPAATLNAWTRQINQYGVVSYLAATNELTGDRLGPASMYSVTPSPMEPYNLGDHAGWTFTITVAIV